MFSFLTFLFLSLLKKNCCFFRKNINISRNRADFKLPSTYSLYNSFNFLFYLFNTNDRGFLTQFGKLMKYM